MGRTLATLSAALVLLPYTENASENSQRIPASLQEYAAYAKAKGKTQIPIGYMQDEEEGSWGSDSSIDSAAESYEWVAGTPIDSKVVTFPNSLNISTLQRVQVQGRWGRPKGFSDSPALFAMYLRQLEPGPGQVIVLHSGGAVTVDGVQFHKTGQACMQLAHRPYLMAMEMDGSRRIGTLRMGCAGLFLLDGDRLTPTLQRHDPVPDSMASQYHNSLKAFASHFASKTK